MKQARLIVAASEHCADLLYASGFNAPDEFIWFRHAHGRQAVVLNTLEYGRALRQVNPGIEVLNRDEFFSEADTDRSMVKTLTAMAAKLNIHEFEVPRDFPLYYADTLREEGIKVTAGPAVFFQERQYKTPREIEHITAALRAAEDAERRVAAILAESSVGTDSILVWHDSPLSSEILRNEIAITLMKHDTNATSTIVACGCQSAQPHNTGSGPIHAGQPIVVDIFPRSNAFGYWGDVTRTFVKGQAPDIVRRAFEAVREARDSAVTMIKPGIRAADVHNHAAAIMRSHGFDDGRSELGDFGFIHGLGHGVGLDIHEWPRLNSANNLCLKAGEVVTVEPGLYYPEWGGIRLEDMVVIENDSCRRLNSLETYLEIP